MTTTVSTIDEAAKALEQSIVTARADLGAAVGDIGVMVATAKAIRLIKEALTDEIMTDFMSLMNSAHGFKTDRPNNKDSTFYSKDEVRSCLVEAFLKGAKCVGNEFNIIVGQCYLTKEFYDRKIKQLPTVREFKGMVGAAAMSSKKTAVLPATATWVDTKTGEVQTLELTDQRATGGHDFRVMVNAWEGSSPDELHGKGESKLWRRAYKQMTGEDISDEPTTLDGAVVPASKLEGKPTKAIEKKSGPVATSAERVAKAIEAFGKIGVTEDMLVAKLGHPLLTSTEAEMDTLQEHHVAIGKGESRAFEVFEFPDITEQDVRGRFHKLKSMSGITKAADALIERGADADMVDNLATEYIETLKGGE